MASRKRSRWKVLAVSCEATSTEQQTPGAPQSSSPKGTFQSTADFIRCFPGIQELQGVDAQVQFIDRPNLQALQTVVQAFHPNLVFFGQRRPATSKGNGKGGSVGPLMLGGPDPPTAESLTQVFSLHAPDLVLANAVLTAQQAEAIRSKGTQHVIYWPAPAPSSAASHFFSGLFSVLRNPCLNPHDAFRIADASHRIHCADSKPPNPVVSGAPPPREIACSAELQQRISAVDLPAATLLSKPRQELRLLLFGGTRVLAPRSVAALAEGLRVLLAAEIRELRLAHHAAAAAPTEHIAALGERSGSAFVRCELCAGEAARVCVTAVGRPEAFGDRDVLELCLKRELLARLKLQTPPKPASLLPARRTSTIASGAPTCEVTVTLPDWAKDLLCQLAADVTYRPLAALGLAGVGGLAVTSFSAADGTRLRALEETRAREALKDGAKNGLGGENGVRSGGVNSGVGGPPGTANGGSNGGVIDPPGSVEKPVFDLNADGTVGDETSPDGISDAQRDGGVNGGFGDPPERSSDEVADRKRGGGENGGLDDPLKTRVDGTGNGKRDEARGGLNGGPNDPPDARGDEVSDRKRRESELMSNLRAWKHAAIESVRDSDSPLARPVSQRFRQPISLAPVTPEQATPAIGGPGALSGVMSPAPSERPPPIVNDVIASPPHTS